MKHSDSSIIVFTDGACSGNPGPGGFGAIVARTDGTVAEFGGGESPTTNNRMELMAAIVALESLPKFRGRVELYTDSQYVIQGITAWIFGWRRNGWKSSQGNDVVNRDLWERLAAVNFARKEGDRVEWIHVPGHSEIPGNERCDAIAVAFAQGEEIQLYQGSAKEYSVDLSLPDNLEELSARRSAEKKSGTKSKGKNYYLSYLDGKLLRHQTWIECEARVKGRAGAKFQKCGSLEEEQEILKKWRVTSA